jgi:phospholipid/cholesterol/gamma-HCH transport system substrate-binding protein
MPASIKTVLIGIFVIVAAVVLVSMLLYIHPTVGDNAKTLRIRFTDVDKIDIGTRVTYAGHPVGEVVSIKELPEARTSRLNYEGDVYVYEIEAKVDSGVDVFNTDEVTVRTSGLLGEKNVEINPMPPKPGQPLFKVENQVLYAIPVGTVESTLKSFSELTKKIEDTLKSIQVVIDDIKKEEIVEDVSKITKNLVDITHALNRPDKLTEMIDNMTTLSDRALHSWDTVDNTLNNAYAISDNAYRSWPKVDRALDQFNAAADNTKEFTNSAKQIIDYTKSGKGSMGRLFMGSDLYLQVKSILHKGENLMGDINQFGLLFQTNKRWQRLEAQRRNLVQTLSDPNQFTNYFNNEMDNISSNLSSVSMILNNSQYSDPRSLYFNPNFTLQFSELMKNVANMEETIKLYNEQLANMD